MSVDGSRAVVFAAGAAPRGLALSPDGSRAAMWCDHGVSVRSGDGEPVMLAADDTVHVAGFTDELWRVFDAAAGLEVEARSWDGALLAGPCALPELGRGRELRTGDGALPSVVAIGRGACELRRDGATWQALPLAGQLSAGGATVAVENGRVSVLRHGQRFTLELGTAGELCGGRSILGGGYLALELARTAERMLVVIDMRRGQLVRRIRVEGHSTVTIVERRGHAVIVRDGAQLTVFDLIGNRFIGERMLDAPVAALAVSADARIAATAGCDGRIATLPYNDLLTRRGLVAVAPTPSPEPEAVSPSGSPAPDAAPVVEDAAPVVEDVGDDAERVIEVPVLEAPEAPPEVAAPRVAPGTLRGLAPRAQVPPLSADDVDRYLADAFELVAALCGRAIATAWDTGRIGGGGELAHADEVSAILDGRGGRATARVSSAEVRERAAWSGLGAWNCAGAPHVELAAELGLSPLACAMLLAIAAPALWGELARAYGVLSNDRARPLCDELLVVQLLGAGPRVRRDIARELEDDAPLIRHGLVLRGPGRRPFAELTASDAAVARLAGDDGATVARTGMIETRDADRELASLHVAAAPLAALLDVLEVPAERPARVVLRGRTGAGRRTLAAALAARTGRRLALLDPSAAGRDQLADRLRAGLIDAHVRGWLPCVSGLDHFDEPAQAAAVRAVLDAHPGPLVIRTGLDGAPPLAPGFAACDLGSLTLDQRERAWRDALVAHGLDTAAATALAARYDVGPGTMARAAATAAARGARGDVGEALRQHRATRIAAVAERVDRLARWEDLVVDDEVGDRLRGFCERVRYREHVLDRLGMARVASTGRSLCALFQGGPGTGKTMVAGVIARELGYELYRVDLSKVVSKWIGETEKNLATVFEAAEDGDVILLFDEADSLFAKRTEVKSSNDRNANLEVNYLLQRLDSFTGVAILTTNFGTVIDPAFKRRLAARITFALPDETLRARLWQTHLPPTLRRRGDLELEALATRYEMSGGYIRNAALRAAYVAASRSCPLDAALLEEAVRAEYREADRLREGGPLT